MWGIVYGRCKGERGSWGWRGQLFEATGQKNDDHDNKCESGSDQNRKLDGVPITCDSGHATLRRIFYGVFDWQCFILAITGDIFGGPICKLSAVVFLAYAIAIRDLPTTALLALRINPFGRVNCSFFALPRACPSGHICLL